MYKKISLSLFLLLLSSAGIASAIAGGTVALVNQTTCVCTGHFPDYVPCAIDPTKAATVQPVKDENLDPTDNTIAPGASGPAPIFTTTNGVNAVGVTVNGGPYMLEGNLIQPTDYVIDNPPMANFDQYVIVNQPFC